MTYANVKCEECGLIMPQNEAYAVEVDTEAAVASNDPSFGLSGRRLRLWQQGNRTYTRTKRIFFCLTCYQNYKASVASLPAPEQPSRFRVFLKMWWWSILYKMWRAVCRAVWDALFKA